MFTVQEARKELEAVMAIDLINYDCPYCSAKNSAKIIRRFSIINSTVSTEPTIFDMRCNQCNKEWVEPDYGNVEISKAVAS